MNAIEMGGQEVPAVGGSPQEAVARVAMPEVAQTLTTWRWMVRQIPRSVATLSALGAAAAGGWAFLIGGQLLLATAIACEVTALLALWLDRQWRQNEDLSQRMDQIAHNALHAGGEVLDGLRSQNRHLGDALEELRRTNQQLASTSRQLSEERDAVQRTLAAAENELLQFRETEQTRQESISAHRRVLEELHNLLHAANERVSHEDYWNRLTDGLRDVSNRYDQLLEQERAGQPQWESFQALVQQVEQLRTEAQSRQGGTPGEQGLRDSLDRVMQLLSDLSERLLQTQQQHLQGSIQIEAERRRGEHLQTQLSSLQGRMGSLQAILEHVRRAGADAGSIANPAAGR